MNKKLFISLLLLLASNAIFSQRNIYEYYKSFVVQIGIVKDNKFIEDGTGLVTYMKLDSVEVHCIITAGHVIDDFVNSNQKGFYVRPSWADSLKTSEYLGTFIPLKVNGLTMFFKPEDHSVDLGCILYAIDTSDHVARSYYAKNKAKEFPLNGIQNPLLGQKVVVFGYPLHVENQFAKYNYSVCTVKPGIVGWVPNSDLNSEIDNYILIESNATHGNSGGPVFTDPDLDNQAQQLVGIVHGGYDDDTMLPLKIGNKIMGDTVSKKPYYVVTKSGVTTIVKAKLVRSFISEIEGKIQIIGYRKLFNW
jgi:hypothetical protein